MNWTGTAVPVNVAWEKCYDCGDFYPTAMQCPKCFIKRMQTIQEFVTQMEQIKREQGDQAAAHWLKEQFEAYVTEMALTRKAP